MVLVDKLQSLPAVDLDKHMSAVADVLISPEKRPPSQKRVHLLNYVATIACSGALAGNLVHRGVLGALARQVKDVQPVDLSVSGVPTGTLILSFKPYFKLFAP